MNMLEEHLGQMESLEQSTGRYVLENGVFGNYLRSLRTAFSKFTGYRYNQFRDVTESDVIEHVPQKESFHPKDAVEELVSGGWECFGTGSSKIYANLKHAKHAEHACQKALDLNRKFEAGCDEKIRGLSSTIVDFWVSRINDDIKGQRPIVAEMTYLSLKDTVRNLEMDEGLLKALATNVVDSYIEVAQNDFKGGDEFMCRGEWFAEQTGVDFKKQLLRLISGPGRI